MEGNTRGDARDEGEYWRALDSRRRGRSMVLVKDIPRIVLEYIINRIVYMGTVIWCIIGIGDTYPDVCYFGK